MSNGHKHEKDARPGFTNGETQRDIHIAEMGRTTAPEGPHELTRIAVWRPIPNKTHVVPDPSLNEEERALIQELKGYTQNNLILKTEDEDYEDYAKWENRFLSMPDTYPRYLRASQWKLEEARRRLRETLQWRRQYRPDLIKPDEIALEAEGGKVVLNGFDTTGKPILWLRPSKENTKPSPLQIRHLIFQLERAIDLMPSGVTQLALVVDYHGATAQNNPSTETAKEVIYILQNHYCERLGRAVVMNVPWYLNAFFNVVKPLLDPKTKDKIKFNPHMEDLVTREQLDEEFGGELAYQYDSRVYLPALCRFCGIKQDGTREAWIPKDYPEHDLAKPDLIQRKLNDTQADRHSVYQQKSEQQPNGHNFASAEISSADRVSSSIPESVAAPAKPAPPPLAEDLNINRSGVNHSDDIVDVAVISGDAGAASIKPDKPEMETISAPNHSTTHPVEPESRQVSQPAAMQNSASHSASAGSTPGKKRGGPNLFSSKRGLDKAGQPTLHKHKHIIKALCMHKGSIPPSTSMASTSTASTSETSRGNQDLPSIVVSDDTLVAEPGREKIRIASDANESRPHEAPLPTDTSFGPDANATAMGAPEGETADFFTDGRHRMVPVNDHEDHAEVVSKPQDLMHRLQTDTSEQLTMAFQVMKPPTDMAGTNGA